MRHHRQSNGFHKHRLSQAEEAMLVRVPPANVGIHQVLTKYECAFALPHQYLEHPEWPGTELAVKDVFADMDQKALAEGMDLSTAETWIRANDYQPYTFFLRRYRKL